MNRAKLTLSIGAAIVVPVLLLTGSLVLVSGQASSHQTKIRPTSSPPPLAPRPSSAIHGFLVGVREHGSPGPWVQVARFAAAAGTTPRLVLYYSGWYEPFQTAFAKTAAKHGAEVLVQIQPYGVLLSKVAAGHYDQYLRSYARQVATFRQPVVIGFGHEMNGRWYPWGYGHQSEAAFVAAWKHIVTIFNQQGAANVRWLWTVSSDVKRSLRPYWPGSRYVTWVGIDGYYYRPGQHFSATFGRAIRQVHALTNAPILLSEAAIAQAAGQARTMPDLFAGIRRNHLLGLVWFDVAQRFGRVHLDWRLEGHPAALAAFRRGLLSVAAS